jgi:Secretin and TonB N terminus short domain
VTPAVNLLRRRSAQWVLVAGLVWGAAGSLLNAQQLPSAIRQSDQPTAFDFPSEPLAIALERLMAATSLAIIVDSGLTDGRRSSSLNGIFTPEQALRRMLAGTGLEARAVGGGLFTLVQGTARPPLPRFIDFAAAVQAAVTDALCRRSDARPTYYRTVMRLWFDPAGVVTRAELGHSTGDRKLDMAVISTLQHLDVGAPLPSGLPQPVKLAIMPRATESAACPAERPGLRAQDDSRSVAPGAGR